jgi:hypothetical protein
MKKISLLLLSLSLALHAEEEPSSEEKSKEVNVTAIVAGFIAIAVVTGAAILSNTIHE